MGPGNKRKRGDRTFSQDSNDGSNRPSPHRPGNLNLAQQNQSQNGRGHRRPSRGGRGGAPPPRSPITGVNAHPLQARPSTTTSNPMSPPPPTFYQNRTTPTSHPPTPPARPSAGQHVAPPPALLTPYDYRYVTSERLASWRTAGRRAVIDDTSAAMREGDQVAISEIFQELLKAGLEVRLDATEAGGTIRDILGDPQGTAYQELSASFLDSLSIVMEPLDTSDVAMLPILRATGISPGLLREELDASLLKTLGLIRSTFDKVLIRHQTNLLYRQSNYNLLREESEGYSKLVTELFTTSNKVTPTGEVVEDTFERIKALIGTFDLDVGRVLDVTLDVFASVLVREYRFFIKFLRASSWWPHDRLAGEVKITHQGFSSLPNWALPGSSHWVSTEEDRDRIESLKRVRDQQFWDRARGVGVDAFFELGGRRVMSEQGLSGELDGPSKSAQDNSEDKEWIETTHSLPPFGNRVAAQLLGFKLRFYASEARDSTEVLPENLIFLAALLIKIGFISLRDLYPHLYPPDEMMESVREKQMRERADREKLKRVGGGTTNALMTAGALSDDTMPPPVTRLREVDGSRGTPTRSEPGGERAAAPASKPGEQDEEKEKLPEPADQKVALLKSLLAIGAIPEALFILGRFPWLPDAFPDLPEHIHRILHVCLSKVAATVQPAAARAGLGEAKPIWSDQGVSKGHLQQTEAPPRKVLRWAQIDRFDVNEGSDYRFYWDDWADNVPICQNVDDVFTLCGTLLNYTGVKIGQDPSLLIKLARIGKKSITEDASEPNLDRWIDLCKRLLAPALTLTKGNPGVVNEVFDLLKCFNTRTRYSIYAEWYNGAASRLPDIKMAFEFAGRETSDLMKRISNDNTKPMARLLAKIAYSSPGIVFSVAFRQIEAYNNLAEVVVECSRYFTYLGYDVLTWSLIGALGGRGRNRKQADGMLISPWLTALSLFAGKVYKRHSIMNPSPLLQYIAEQLRQNNPTDLEILRQLVQSMAGIEDDMTFNDSQIHAMAGGELLQAQTLLQLRDQRHNLKNSSRRLIRSLMEPGLTGQLLVSIAQQRQTFVYRGAQDNDPLKPLAENLDQIHRSLVQYLDMLHTNLSAKEFESAVPGVVSLISDFGLEPAVAFMICRPSIAQAITELDVSIKLEKLQERLRRLSTEKPAEQSQVNGDVNMKDDPPVASPESGAVDDKQQGTAITQADAAEQTVENVDMRDPSPPVDLPTPTTNAAAVSNEAHEPWHPALKPLIDKLRPVLPADFEGRLSLPFYITFWQLSLADMLVPSSSYDDENKRLKDRVNAINADRTDVSAYGVRKKEADRKQVMELLDRLRAELKSQIQSHTQVRARLNREKDSWFAGFYGRWDDLNESILQECFFPRIFLSPIDAHFTFRMLFFLHSSGAPCFRTIGLIDRIMRDKQLTSIIFLCTVREAENFAKFLNELLKEMARWHADRLVYEKVAYGTKRDLPGFAKKVTPENVPVSLMDFEDFRRILYKWHRSLNAAFKSCLSSGEYMHTMNAIIILNQIYKYFPAVNWIGAAMINSASELSSDERGDIKIAATSLLVNLRRREKEWVMPQAFYTPEAQPPGHTATSRASSARPSTPHPDQARSLNASAPEMKLQFAPNGIETSSPTAAPEAEDGEVEDTKLTEIKPRPTPTVTTSPAPNNETTTLAAGSKSELNQPPPTGISEQPPTRSETVTEMSKPTRQKEPQSPPTASIPLRPDQPSPVPRNDANTTLSITSLPGRPPHGLPNRPENPSQPSRGRLPDRLPDSSLDFHNGRLDGRALAYAEHSRLEGPGEHTSIGGSERRPISPGRRIRARTPEPRGNADRERRQPPQEGLRDSRMQPQEERGMRRPPRELQPVPRGPSWDRPNRDIPPIRHVSGGAPSPDGRLRTNGTGPMLPPASNIPIHPDRAANINPERPAQTNPAPQRPPPNPQPARALEAVDRAGMNPARAALPNGNFDQRNGTFIGERGDRRDRPPRPSPPRRNSDRAPQPDSYRDDRLPVSERPPPRNAPRMRDLYEDDTASAPNGPRGDRGHPNFPDAGPPLRARELVQSNGPPRTSVDLTHGRLSQDFSPSSRQQDPNYGRLNGGPDAPSGPRRRNSIGRSGHGVGAPQYPASARQPEGPSQFPASTTAGVPSGPAISRNDREAGRFDRPPPAPGSASAPHTPVAEQPAVDTAGVHPSRLRNIPNPPAVSSVHGQVINPGNQANSGASLPPPAGPRADQRGPPPPANYTSSNINPTTASTGLPSMAPRNAPSGPASAAERRRFAGLQDALQQAGSYPASTIDRNDRGASIRGRAGRQNNISGAGFPAAAAGVTLPPPPPAQSRDAARSENLPAKPEPAGGRTDLFSDRNDDRINAPHSQNAADDDRADSRRRASGRREGEKTGRFGRHRESREHSRDRHPEDERRDRRSGGERDNRDGRRMRDDGRDKDRRDPRESSNAREDELRRGGPSQQEGDFSFGGGEPRGRGGGAERRDGRDRGGDDRKDMRDMRKRGRGMDESLVGHGDHKRPRRLGH